MIYCVEDDASIRELIVYTLQSTGFCARGFPSGKELFAALKDETPELILLDIMLPGDDGISILKKLRADKRTADVPIIMATAKTSEYDKVLGLDTGADDYITKPFGMMELVSRVKAALRRYRKVSPAKKEDVHFQSVRINAEKHTVTVNGEPVALTLKEFELLLYLMENKGIVLMRDKLLEHIWGYDFSGETRTVDVHIRTLRQKLGSEGDIVETVRGVGYRIGGGHET